MTRRSNPEEARRESGSEREAVVFVGHGHIEPEANALQIGLASIRKFLR